MSDSVPLVEAICNAFLLAGPAQLVTCSLGSRATFCYIHEASVKHLMIPSLGSLATFSRLWVASLNHLMIQFLGSRPANHKVVTRGK